MPIENETLEIGSEAKGVRLDHYLAETYPQLTRAYLQKQIALQKIVVNHKPARKGQILKIGDTITIVELLEFGERKAQPNPELSIPILFSDAYLAVIDKPAGIATHPVSFEDKNTVANWWIGRFPDVLATAEEPLRPGIVHRLDTGTSGLLILARSSEIVSQLQNQFKSRQIKKEYLALVVGKPPQKGRIDFPLAHDPKSKRRMMAVKTKKHLKTLKVRQAITEYESVEKFSRFTLLRVRTLTGRMHQVRCHLSAIGHPLVGDRIYTRSAHHDLLGAQLNRHFLHASSIQFRHPISDAELRFESPLPEELQNIISQARLIG